MGVPEPFIRRATGVVKVISPHQAFIYNMMAIGFYGFTWATLFSVGYTPSFGGANTGLAILLMALGAIPFYLCTSLLSASMPRSGGDYVWQSRVLHPSVGFASTFSAWTVWQWYFASYLGVVITTLGIQPFFALLGVSNPYFAGIASSLSSGYGQVGNTPVFLITTAVIILGFVIASLGMRFYVRLQYFLFAGSVSSAAALLLVLATLGHTGFVERLNHFVSSVLGSTAQFQSAGGYYQYVINTAKVGIQAPSLGSTLLLFGIIWISFGYAFWSIYNLAEVKRAESVKVHLWTQLGSSLAFSVFLILLWYLLENVMGLDFLRSFYTLYASGDPSTAPLSSLYEPYYPALVASLTNNPLVWAVILIGLTFGLFQVVLIVYFASTRIMLAASMDRVLPGRFAYVSPRTHSPLVSLLASTIGCEVFLYVIVYQSQLTSYFSTAGLATQIAYIMISVTAILFPYRRKVDYLSSPIRRSVFGIPLISLAGVLSLIVNLYIAWIFVAGPPLGFLSVSTAASIGFVAGIFLLCLLSYYVASAYRRKKGLDISLSFKVIPPE